MIRLQVVMKGRHQESEEASRDMKYVPNLGGTGQVWPTGSHTLGMS